jgi:hypothetical protein
VKVGNHMIFIVFSYYFHIIFTFWDPGPGPGLQSGGGPGPSRAPCSRFRAWARVPGSKMWKWYKIIWKNVKKMWFANFTLVSHLFHISIIFILHVCARDPDSDHKSHIFVIFLVILFSYDFHICVYTWAGGPAHSAIFERYNAAGQQSSQIMRPQHSQPRANMFRTQLDAFLWGPYLERNNMC